jgi:hypothetical protein
MRSRNERNPPASNPRSIFVCWAWCTALLLTGCAGYRLGPSGGQVAGEKSIQVSPFANQTLEPRLGEAVTTALRKNLQRDGTYRLATRGDADIVVTGEITRYNRFELSYEAKDILTVRDYRVTLTAHVIARERGTDKIILDRVVTGNTPVRAGADWASAERQALPLMAQDLAKNVAALLVDGNW